MKRFLIIAAALVLGGCMTSKTGNERIVDDQTISKIVPEKSTKADVKAILGEPGQIMFSEMRVGEETWMYFFLESSVRGSTFVPFYGLAKGGADSKTHTLNIRFSKDGIVQQVGKGTSTGDMKMGK